jgi:hypothetical protein
VWIVAPETSATEFATLNRGSPLFARKDLVIKPSGGADAGEA